MNEEEKYGWILGDTFRYKVSKTPFLITKNPTKKNRLVTFENHKPVNNKNVFNTKDEAINEAIKRENDKIKISQRIINKLQEELG